MKHRLLYIPILFLFSLSFVDCAKKGTPSGGKRDSIPPVIVKSNPENYSINFKGDEIRIYFDEYIKLKDLQKELIISPPLKSQPSITPLSASKILKIKISDTLKENTTYSFNFGNSIVDNNEGNAFEYFKYVISTGSYIDSLKLSGTVVDAKLLKPELPVTVMLYEVNDTFKDSLVLSEKPTYITTTKDSIGTFELTNLKEGDYLLLALKEKNNDYTFQPRSDKIAYEKSIVTLPTDSSYVLTLFKEQVEYKIARPKQLNKNEIIFGYEGPANDLSVELISEVPPDFEAKVFRDRIKDTLHYWFKPAISNDSLLFLAKTKNQVDTLTVKLRDMFRDSLKISAINAGVLTPKDTLKISANTPIISVASERITVQNKDSVAIESTVVIDTIYNIAKLIFPKQMEQRYKVQLLPGAITDFFGKENDTLDYTITTKTVSDYGTLGLTLSNLKELPIIVQLTDDKFKVVSEKYLNENDAVLFDYLNPGYYYLRIVYDTNENGIWDSGNFLNRIAPERIKYYPSKIEMRANWSLNETFILE
ncbi:Ig-like domain-containing protein [Ulvibacter antarcticus]|uniref:Ig-like domain-containing protein n=1 Tax=Ulvibacter antarcticus TaxID=442714 RepID=A0A3L9Z114_9FLAO|nr:Ig-like domain-containing protein [Ulvibacter antarcticus]RMA65800.1 Ig-like domain-containing protein [Ulvibacter antarcticus]